MSTSTVSSKPNSADERGNKQFREDSGSQHQNMALSTRCKARGGAFFGSSCPKRVSFVKGRWRSHGPWGLHIQVGRSLQQLPTRPQASAMVWSLEHAITPPLHESNAKAQLTTSWHKRPNPYGLRGRRVKHLYHARAEALRQETMGSQFAVEGRE